jgi:regulator of cell morphogenesis and NO signaling
MTINSTMTVRELVTEMPGATKILEKFKIDYCCGGNAPLTEACAKACVDVQAIENLLESVATGKTVGAVVSMN